MKWFEFVAEFFAEIFGFVIPSDDDGHLLVFDEAKFFGHGLILEEEG